MKALIEAHADLQARSQARDSLAIHFAARVGDLESVKLLLAAGSGCEPPNPDWRGRSGKVRPGAGRRRFRLGPQGGDHTATTPLLVATSVGPGGSSRCILLDRGANPNIEAAGYYALHWASTSWEGYASNPVYGFEDPMSGIWDRRAKLRLVKALLAHGANVNARMTKRQPSFATGYTDTVGATALLLAASVDDVEMMRILL